MAGLIPDTLDFSSYMRSTDAQVKVRAASQFEADLVDEFKPKDKASVSEMFSTKLRGLVDFRPGEVTAWAGYNGHRKSMLTGQLALDLCAQKRRVLIASMEMSPGKTLARMARQAFGTNRPLQMELERFATWTNGRLWLFDHLGRTSPDVMLAVCRYFAQELGGQHVFIDSMMMVCNSEESLDEQKQLTTDLVRTALETGLHIHLIAHCKKPIDETKCPTKYDVRGSAAISDQCPNVITTWANKAKKQALEQRPYDEMALAEPDQLVSVEKQRNGDFEGRIKLWFDHHSMRFKDDRLTTVQPYQLGE